ncbi:MULTISPECIES: hypothetical protein [Flavobacterium]|uniref:hypothetical protein n=1 Tax=Flavobacterium TaxID=237 RepID=UPI001FCBBF12|nr:MULTISPECIES: hypothetical protein [Flavobacterium]UOK43409.1 hypothetical protein LZF87_04630 [Flavobacterium enshiense]
MELIFEDIAIIVKADELDVPKGLSEENLFLFLKPQISNLLEKGNMNLIYIGMAPDNTADGNDELLYDGQLVRIICNEKYLGIKLNNSEDEIIGAFLDLISNYSPFWTTIIKERGFIKKEITIDLLYRNPFTLE